MEILASCSLEEASKFNGKLVLPNEDSKRPDKVFLNIEYSESDGSVADFFARVGILGSSFVKCVSFNKDISDEDIPEEFSGKVFLYKDKNSCFNNELPLGRKFTYLVKLPGDFPDKDLYKFSLRDLVDLCNKYPNIRFVGGNLLKIRGLNIGRFPEGRKDSMYIFNDIYDSFVEVNLEDIDGLKEIVKKVRVKADGTKPRLSKSSKSSSGIKSKRVVAFKTMFGDDEEVDF